MNIIERVRQCTLCRGELPFEPRPVIQGLPTAKIMIAGQAPSMTVHKTGKPFNDASGKRLRDWLGVTETQFYDPALFAIVPMAFCYPGKGKSGDLPPPKICAQTWRAPLLEVFEQIEFTVLIGQYAQGYHLTDFVNVSQAVAGWQSSLPKLIALPHPSPRNQLWLRKRPWFEADVIPALRGRIQEVLGDF
ncbi:uracil-DNA glycosylase [Pseudoalteromonas rubra]|uniref:Uracil-DNA glycosylase n=1 Tax=Pseudoalteromonas rubra TaxID=43658 RepID=A0A5S3WL83_9GAMM|nr:uracil-DNA glycosylase family protein [Pseudoalteromonas rubra]TMP27622.1 uracil-DNA glycosylase [Pseudoalteromonas rubra]TMP28895.1 uracil-DNA glycosylase [Pseudoalteromonas rubra]